MVDLEKKAGWYLAQLKPHAARIAARNLMQQGFDVFLPEEEATRRRGSGFVTEVRPVFPGYIFVALDAARGAWGAVNATRGVSRLVSFGARPPEVPPALVEELMRRYGPLEPPEATDPPRPGAQVRVARGAFAGLLAEIENVTPDRRAWLLMDVLGTRTRVAADLRALRPV